MALKKTKEMKSLQWNQPEMDRQIKRAFKIHYKKKITSAKINKVCRDFIEQYISIPLSKGEIVTINEHVFMVKSKHIADNKRIMSLLDKGLMYKNGRIVRANLNFDTSSHIEKIVYENKDREQNNKLFFEAHKNIKASVRKGIISGKLVSRL
jgi:hypothetical protein